ncbi:MAG: Unknown protein [uncultured Thiotrichaceae bacterium]|uniref:Uncharacterized protein n=1 Tax=uncultured Thiotrichaceae bacterium TaxID=298394 RepID=A0A6S6T5H1_9GAMM|nr:MAG: Unknown protein [uncultured Thiotrichaceae bacterium]
MVLVKRHGYAQNKVVNIQLHQLSAICGGVYAIYHKIHVKNVVLRQ